MKKFILLLLFATIGWQHALAQSFSNGGITYTMNTSTTVSIENQNVNLISDPDLIIPAEVTYNDRIFTVTSISQFAFQYYSNLTSVTIPNTVKSIGQYAFHYCTGLTSVTIPNSVEVISANAFDSCVSLTSVTIPNSVSIIGVGAFQDCTGLTSVTIPSSVTLIGSWAFYNCTSLTSLICYIPNPLPIDENVFGLVDQGACTLKVSGGAIGDYISASVWQNFAPITYINPNVSTFSQVAPICSGEQLAALPTSSNEGITGTWSPALNNLSTTTYYFTPDVGQIATTATLEIVVYRTPSPIVGDSGINVSINGDCSYLNGLFKLNGTLNGKNNYYSSFGTGLKISYDGTKWVFWTMDINYPAFINYNVPAGNVAPLTGWIATAYSNCNNTTLTITPDNKLSLCTGATVADITTGASELKWYGTATGGAALASTTLLSSGTYYVSQIINGCESARVISTITITPISDHYTTITTCEPYTWNGQIYTTSEIYSGSTTNCVTEKLDLTIINKVTPTFLQVAPICSGATLAALPTTSNNAVTGTWSPALNNLATTTYTFTPNAGQCATATTMTIVVRTAGTIVGGNVTVCAPGNSNSTAVGFSLNNNSPGLTIQWQKSFNYENTNSATPSWSTVVNVTGTNNSVQIVGRGVTVSNLTSTTWYRARVTNGSCVSFTDPVKFTVSPLARAGAVTSLSSVCAGGSITFTSAAYTGSSIAWEVSTTSGSTGFSTVAGENGMTYTMNNAPSSTFYVRSVVTSGGCSIARSGVKTVIVNPLSVGGTITGGGTVCSGSNKSLKIAGNTGTIQWMYSTNGTNFMNVPTGSAIATTFSTTSISSSASSYSINNITGTAFFKAVVKSGLCSSAESNVVVFNTATTASPVDLSVESAQVCSGSATSLYLPLFVGDVKIQKSINWTSARPTWTTVTLKMTQTLYNRQYGAFSTGALTQTTAYRAVSSIGNCAPVVYGSIAVIGVNECTFTREIETAVAIKTPFEVFAYPNPSSNVFNFKVNGANDETVSILVFDMTGRQIENKVVKANDVENLALGQNYSTGIYNVIVSQGMNTKTVRLVKK